MRSYVSLVEGSLAIVFKPARVVRQGEDRLRCFGVLGVLEQLENEVGLVRIEILEDVQVDVPFIRIESVKEFPPLSNELFEELTHDVLPFTKTEPKTTGVARMSALFAACCNS